MKRLGGGECPWPGNLRSPIGEVEHGEHLFDRGAQGQFPLSGLPEVAGRQGADQLAVDKQRAPAHPGRGPAGAIGDRSGRAKQDQVADRDHVPAALQNAHDFNIELLDFLALDDSAPDATHAGLDVAQRHDRRQHNLGLRPAHQRRQHDRQYHPHHHDAPDHAPASLALTPRPHLTLTLPFPTREGNWVERHRRLWW